MKAALELIFYIALFTGFLSFVAGACWSVGSYWAMQAMWWIMGGAAF